MIDLWFPEAYQKLATLLLDKRDYRMASLELSRFAVYLKASGSFDHYNRNRPLISTLLQYLTEAHARLYEIGAAEYYASKTITIDPENQFAQMVLDRIKSFK